MIYIDLKNVAGYFNEYYIVILLTVSFVDFLLGVTNKVYGNSIVECLFRLLGWTTLKTFRLRGKKLHKRKGRRS